MSTRKSNEILLLKKGKRGVLRIIFGRTGVVVTLLLSQILILIRVFKFVKGLIPG